MMSAPVAILPDHAVEPSHLPLDAPQALQVSVLALRIYADGLPTLGCVASAATAGMYAGLLSGFHVLLVYVSSERNPYPARVSVTIIPPTSMSSVAFYTS
jgi:hypothetical protein